MTSYDEIPYDSHAFPGTHPDQMALMARLFSVDTAPVSNCRVLELGCAAGGNLVPMAHSLPGSTFVGLDLSERQIADGQAMIDALGVSNVRLEARDVLSIDKSFGTFDYIICHGVYSWVPPAVQEKILAVCSENLAENGLAYVSYNTLPGWHLRGTVRDMMQYHAARFTDSAKRIEQSRALLDFLIGALPEDGSAYSRLLHDELHIIKDRADNYLFHEHLEDHNEPLYFNEFARRAGKSGLRFLSENYLSQMVPNQFSPEVGQTLSDIASDLTHMEQYMDFLRGRMFRCSLLCHETVEPNRVVTRDRLMDCFAAAPLMPESGGDTFETTPAAVFIHGTDSRITVGPALQQAALWTLGRHWPAQFEVSDLAQRARALTGGEASDDSDREQVADILLEALSGDLVEMRLAPQRFCVDVSAQPKGCALARHMAQDSYKVTNRRHETVFLNSVGRQTLKLLDGHRNHEDIAAGLCELVRQGEMTIQRGDANITDEGEVRETVDEALGKVLEELARRALLVA
ncbi:MAG: methyltransferase regulatory domain-containing protein [Pseudomonadota bacterium]